MESPMDFSVPGLPAISAVIPGRNEATCLVYHENGKRLFVASESDSRLQIIDCMSGSADQPALRCEREKIHTLEATHKEELILFAGTGSPTQPVGQRCAIHYWSLYDNKIIRKFRGHTDQVTSISLCPADDSFLTSSLDRTVRLWTLDQAGCLGEVKLPTEVTKAPLSAFDYTGLVFAVAAGNFEAKVNHLHLYDARNYSSGAFAELKISHEDIETAIQSHVNISPDRARELSQADWKTLKFNRSGDRILVGTDKGMTIILDGFTGAIQQILVVQSPTERAAVSCFTPDDLSVLLGNDDGSISCWDIQTGTLKNTLTGHTGPVSCITANPKYKQLASSCSQTAIWHW